MTILVESTVASGTVITLERLDLKDNTEFYVVAGPYVETFSTLADARIEFNRLTTE